MYRVTAGRYCSASSVGLAVSTLAVYPRTNSTAVIPALFLGITLYRHIPGTFVCFGPGEYAINIEDCARGYCFAAENTFATHCRYRMFLRDNQFPDSRPSAQQARRWLRCSIPVLEEKP